MRLCPYFSRLVQTLIDALISFVASSTLLFTFDSIPQPCFDIRPAAGQSLQSSEIPPSAPRKQTDAAAMVLTILWMPEVSLVLGFDYHCWPLQTLKTRIWFAVEAHRPLARAWWFQPESQVAPWSSWRAAASYAPQSLHTHNRSPSNHSASCGLDSPETEPRWPAE